MNEKAAASRVQAQEAQELYKQVQEIQNKIAEGEEKFLARKKAIT